jgi:hypothetical protein
MMKRQKKKKYEKPRITQIKLDAQCAVLGFCKNAGSIGPGVANCATGSPCSGAGS